jgi:hypothetical protein
VCAIMNFLVLCYIRTFKTKIIPTFFKQFTSYHTESTFTPCITVQSVFECCLGEILLFGLRLLQKKEERLGKQVKYNIDKRSLNHLTVEKQQVLNIMSVRYCVQGGPKVSIQYIVYCIPTFGPSRIFLP